MGFLRFRFAEKPAQNTFGSEAWVTPRFGLAPTTARTAAGALSQLLSDWWRHIQHLLSCRPSWSKHDGRFSIVAAKSFGDLFHFTANRSRLKTIEPRAVVSSDTEH